jgi:hypothetical protein
VVKRKKKQRKPPEPEHILLATVKSVTVSYYIRRHGDGVVDEAITDMLCDIAKMTPNMPQHIGKEVTCSLMCSREYGRVDYPGEKGWPRIGKGQTVPEGSFLLTCGLARMTGCSRRTRLRPHTGRCRRISRAGG